MKAHSKKSLIAWLLVLAMLLSLLPTAALAADTLTAWDVEDTVAGNTRYTLSTLDDPDTAQAFDYTVPDSGVTMLIFFSTGCGRSMRFFQMLADCDWTGDSRLNIVAIESCDHTQEETQSFLDSYAGSAADNMDVRLGGRSLQFSYTYLLYGSGSVAWPFVLLITQEEDGSRVIRYADMQCTSTSLCKASLDALLDGDASSDSTEDTTSGLTDTNTVSLDVTYGQTEARSMLEMINAFRTGEDAWAWDSSNSTQVAYSGLGELSYSYELEADAMQRAVEIALNFSHTRTDGTSCFTIEYSYGENIAAGYPSASAVFEGWLETDDDYSGQGHRRNMLGSYTAVGIAHVVYNGVHYWVQEFGYASQASDPGANDSEATVSVQVDTDLLTELSVEPTASSLTLTLGSSVQIPDVLATLQFTSAWPAGTSTVSVEQVTWVVEDDSVISLGDGVLTGLGLGTTTLSALVLGQTVTVQVTVTHNFDDVTDSTAWYYDAVYWAYDLEITKGYDDGVTQTFKPNNNCTRAEFATFLYQLANAYGLENAGETANKSFTDVTESGWYYDYVMWAAENGIVSGYTDGTFRPNSQITRAEAVTMLHSFYQYFVNGGVVPEVTGESGSAFSDLSSTAWYYTYMAWAIQNGIVSGYPDGTCRPNTNCTRSVMVVLLSATAENLL